MRNEIQHDSAAPVSLKRASMLAALTPDDEAVIRKLDVRTLPAGTRLNAAGDEAHLLLSGWAARRLGEGKNQRVGLFVLPGDPIGLGADDWMGDCLPTFALTDVIVARAGDLVAAVRMHPVRHAALSIACQRATRRDQTLMLSAMLRLGSQSAATRASHLFLEFYQRLAEVGLTQGARFRLPVSQQLVAQAVGLSLVHMSRILRQLRREKLITLKNGMLELLDLGALSALADFGSVCAGEQKLLLCRGHGEFH